jgi:hypothetical protein
MGFFKKLKKKITLKGALKMATAGGAYNLINMATKGKTAPPDPEGYAKAHPGITGVEGILSHGGKGTWLDPAGDPAENAAFGDAWGRMGRNRELSAVNAASVDSPDDPYATGFARTKARIASGSDQANAFANYKLGQSQRRGAAMTDLLQQAYGQDWQNISGSRAENEARRGRNAELWGAAGGLGGKAVSAFGGGG